MPDPIQRLTGFVIKPFVRQPGKGRPPRPEDYAPNICAHLSLLCALLPVLVLGALVCTKLAEPEVTWETMRVGQLIAAFITLLGALFGGLGGWCYWIAPQRRGLRYAVIGLIGCGFWALCFSGILRLILNRI